MITLNARCHLRNVTVDGANEDVMGVVVTGARTTVEHSVFRNFTHGYYPLNSYTANYSRFVNNEFINNGDRGLAITGAPSDGLAWNDFSLVANNIFRGNGEGPKIRGARYCLFEGNTIHGDSDNTSNAAGVLLQSIDEPNQHCLVTGNTIFAPDNPGGSTFGVRVAEDRHGDSRYNMVTNNVIYSQDFGILVRSPDTTVANNLITNGQPAVLVDGSGDRVNLINNMIQRGDIRIEASGGIIKGNVARNSTLYGGDYVEGNYGL
jgi:parallel beta-helix repeat protein